MSLKPELETERSVIEKETEREKRAAVDRAKAVGRLLDDAIRIPGIGYRIGIDPLLGILPVAGDSVATIGSLYIVYLGITVGVPLRTVAQMLLLVGIDFTVGSVPVLGTLVDAVLKVNRRNAATIEAHVDATA